MWILDTNVVSELFRPRPVPSVMAWYYSVSPETFFVTAITQAESFLGCALMPAGQRKDTLERALRIFYDERLLTPILPFERRSVDAYVELVAYRRSKGKPIGEYDAQIAAIARSHGFAVVTRNVRDFEDCGVELVNPWESA